MPTLTEKTVKLTKLGIAIGCTELAPGASVPPGSVVLDENLAYADEQTHSRRGWFQEIHRGNTFVELEETVERVTEKKPRLRLVDRIHVPCPQEAIGECAGDGKHQRIFECPLPKCDFVGCCECYDRHILKPHPGDAAALPGGAL